MRAWRAAASIPALLRFYTRDPLVIGVLGMHRSGTSAVTKMIHLTGASVSDDAIAADPGNPDGYWESRQGIDVNTSMLEASGGSWRDPPPELRCGVGDGLRLRRFLGNLARYEVVVWKDPRAVLTYPVWRPLIKRFLGVAVLRSPLGVARSLERRSGFALEKGLALWLAYNQRLAAIADAEPGMIWIDFDSGAESMAASLQRLASAARLRWNPKVMAGYLPELRTSDSAQALSDEPCARLYARLKARCSGT